MLLSNSNVSISQLYIYFHRYKIIIEGEKAMQDFYGKLSGTKQIDHTMTDTLDASEESA